MSFSSLALGSQQIEEPLANAGEDFGCSFIDVRQRFILVESILDPCHRGVTGPGVDVELASRGQRDL